MDIQIKSLDLFPFGSVKNKFETNDKLKAHDQEYSCRAASNEICPGV